jgi:V8-like Glu-specific endopeptidase
VYGSDDRVRVRGGAARALPYSAVVLLTMPSPDPAATYSCSGSVVGAARRVVLTAAHCVYDFDQGWLAPWQLVTGARSRPSADEVAQVSHGEVLASWVESYGVR